MENNQAYILIVDDEELNLEIISEYLADKYTVSTAVDGVDAWNKLKDRPDKFDVILLDRMMPNMDGMEVLEKIKCHPTLRHVPVIFQTAKASSVDIAEGMSAGAYYYLTKPFSEEILLSVTKTAVNDRLHYKEMQHHLKQTKVTMGKLTSASFEFKTLDEARSIASLVSNACPQPENIVTGLTELLINAIEHGNLGITYQEKSLLNESNTWTEEVEKRLKLEDNKNKTVTLKFKRYAGYIDITVKDQGNGFDWINYMDFDPTRIMDNHGRGIAIANKLSFSQLEYKGKGNEVCARLHL